MTGRHTEIQIIVQLVVTKCFWFQYAHAHHHYKNWSGFRFVELKEGDVFKKEFLVFLAGKMIMGFSLSNQIFSKSRWVKGIGVIAFP